MTIIRAPPPPPPVAYLGFHLWGGGGGGFKIFLKKWGYLHGETTRLLGGGKVRGHAPRENFKKWCNLVRCREYFAIILSKK